MVVAERDGHRACNNEPPREEVSIPDIGETQDFARMELLKIVLSVSPLPKLESPLEWAADCGRGTASMNTPSLGSPALYAHASGLAAGSEEKKGGDVCMRRRVGELSKELLRLHLLEHSLSDHARDVGGAFLLLTPDPFRLILEREMVLRRALHTMCQVFPGNKLIFLEILLIRIP